MDLKTVKEQSFIKQLTKIVEANLSNHLFGVSELAREYGKSRSAIHRKLKLITDQSISKFIRSVRLEKAMQLILEKDISVAEVAYEVGFGSPAYFNHCFHEYFGFPPGEAKAQAAQSGWDENDFYNRIIKKSNDPQMQVLKTKKRMLRILAVLVLSLVIFLGHLIFLAKREMSVIVLPFANYTNGNGDEYFAEGIMEEIQNDLYHITDLRVVSRTSSEQFRQTDFSAREIARKMKVKYVVEGSVRNQGENVRIHVQLIDAYPFREKSVWSENYNRNLMQTIDIQNEISMNIALAIKSSLSEKEITRIKKSSTHNQVAYNNYMQARYLRRKINNPQRHFFDTTSLLNCIKYYEGAISNDNTFAEAYAGLSNVLITYSFLGFLEDNKFLEAREFCKKALELDPANAEAHSSLGLFYTLYDHNYPLAEKEFETSIELNPNFGFSRQAYAQYLMVTGQIETAREQINLALQLEPYFWFVNHLSAFVYYFEKSYEQSLEACSFARNYYPGFVGNHFLFLLNYARLGEGEKMKEYLQERVKNHPKASECSKSIQKAFDENGINGLLDWMIKKNIQNGGEVEGINGNPFFTAWWNALLKNREETLFWLDKTLDEKIERYNYPGFVGTNPDFDFLVDEQEFLSFIDTLGLSPFYH